MYRFSIWLLYGIIRDPEAVHRLARVFIGFLGIRPVSSLTRLLTHVSSSRLEQEVMGLTFRNPVGLAGGLAKDKLVLAGLESLGFGFIEIGTFTREPQDGNPKPRLFRYTREKALVNRMGFNNAGVESLKSELSSMGRMAVPLGISIGKSKNTELAKAPEEYTASLSVLYPYGDYFAVNVSSPNTPGLRKLQDADQLEKILSALNSYRDGQQEKKPILVKISPDLTFEAIDELLAVCERKRVDGIIATNTTIERKVTVESISEAGGLSGLPLRDVSTEIIRYIRRKAPRIPIIGVGGIFSAADAYEKIRAGASLIQIYTGFVYEGPFLVHRINAGLIDLLERDGYKNIKDAIGSRAR